jgi:hypothetical protein
LKKMTQRRAHGAWVLTLALLSRFAVVVWGWNRFPPEADGKFYHTVAQRIAHGEGYTWLWGDGAVTYAAHYPVGYPALVGAGYAVFGPSPGVAMSIAAVLGAVATLLGYDILARHTTPRRALAGGLLLALHPALVPYTVALMTDGLAASLLLVAAWLVDRAAASTTRFRRKALVPLGLLFGALTLLRPQSLVLAPVFGALALRGRGARGYLAGATVVVALTVATCLPWTLRNCARMDRCALVSVNGGWNLLIGAQTESGAWQEIRVPDACRNVFSEAGKDTCFEKAAKEEIRARPVAWLRRIPAKLGATFDYFGAGPWYLHASSPGAFGDAAKTALGAVETLVHRITLLGAFAVLGSGPGRRRPRIVLAALGAVAALFPHGGALAHLALALLAGIDTRLPARLASAVLAATLALHAVFFGAGRYGLVVVPFVVMVAFLRPTVEAEGASGVA